MTTYRSTGRFVWEAVEGIVVSFGTFLPWPLSRFWLLNWGSTPEERSGDWLGDDLCEGPCREITRGIEVCASPDEVWPWIVQFGLGRAGFYSYELLERLVRIPVRNVEVLLPEFQNLNVGDEVLLHPEAPGVPVAILNPAREVCFGHHDITEQTPDPRRSWSIYLREIAPGRTRLVVRSRIEQPREPALMKTIALAVDGPIDFIMEQRMLRTVRRLAERAATRA